MAKTIHDDDPGLSEKIKLAAKIMNLKGHTVFSRGEPPQARFLHAPVDIEGHEGTDKRFYLIDTARVFPPASRTDTKKDVKGWHLYKQLRPEFVKLNPVPLSSDAHSRLGNSDEQEVNNKEVNEATKRLEEVLIPSFASFLDGRFQRHPHIHTLNTTPINRHRTTSVSSDLLSGTSLSSLDESELPIYADSSSHKEDYETEALTPVEELPQIVAEMHLHGINVRYLVHIYELLKTKKMKLLVLSEAVARTAKHLMEARWRVITNTLEDNVFTQALVDFFNLLFGRDGQSEQFWKGELINELIKRFPRSSQSSNNNNYNNNNYNNNNYNNNSHIIPSRTNSPKSESKPVGFKYIDQFNSSLLQLPVLSTSNNNTPIKTTSPRLETKQSFRPTSAIMDFNAASASGSDNSEDDKFYKQIVSHKNADNILSMTFPSPSTSSTPSSSSFTLDSILAQVCNQLHIPTSQQSVTIKKWRDALGNLCSTPNLLMELVNSKYWDKKQFDEDPNNSDMIKVMIEKILSKSEEVSEKPSLYSSYPDHSPSASRSPPKLGDPDFDIRGELDMALLFQRTAMELGVTFDIQRMVTIERSIDSSNDAYDIDEMEPISLNDDGDEEDEYTIINNFLIREEKLSFFHVKSIEPRVKHLHRISFEEGSAIVRLALSQSNNDQMLKLLDKANQKFAECLAIKPNDHRALYNWAFSLTKLAEISPPESAKELWKSVSDKFSRVLVIQPNDGKALFRWGSALLVQALSCPPSSNKWNSSNNHNTTNNYSQSNLNRSGSATTTTTTTTINTQIASTTTGQIINVRSGSSDERGKLFKLACKKLTRASDLLPKHFKTRYNTGNAYLSYAKHLEGGENTKKVSDLLNQAIIHLEEAHSIDPHAVEAMQNLGISLSKKAMYQIDESERDRVYGRCYSVYQRACERDPSNRDLLIGWGNALYRQAQTKVKSNPNKCLHLFMVAAEKFKKALHPQPEELFVDGFKSLCSVLIAFNSAYEMVEKNQINIRMEKLFRNFGKFCLRVIKREFEQNQFVRGYIPLVRLFASGSNKELSKVSLDLLNMYGTFARNTPVGNHRALKTSSSATSKRTIKKSKSFGGPNGVPHLEKRLTDASDEQFSREDILTLLPRKSNTQRKLVVNNTNSNNLSSSNPEVSTNQNVYIPSSITQPPSAPSASTTPIKIPNNNQKDDRNFWARWKEEQKEKNKASSPAKSTSEIFLADTPRDEEFSPEALILSNDINDNDSTYHHHHHHPSVGDEPVIKPKYKFWKREKSKDMKRPTKKSSFKMVLGDDTVTVSKGYSSKTETETSINSPTTMLLDQIGISKQRSFGDLFKKKPSFKTNNSSNNNVNRENSNMLTQSNGSNNATPVGIEKKSSFSVLSYSDEKIKVEKLTPKKDKQSGDKSNKTNIKRTISGMLTPKKSPKTSPKRERGGGGGLNPTITKRSTNRSIDTPNTEASKKKIMIDWSKSLLYSHDGVDDVKLGDLTPDSILGTCKNGLVYAVAKETYESIIKLRRRSNTLNYVPTHIFVFNHPCLVKTLYIFQNKGKLIYVFERINGIHFREFIAQRHKATNDFLSGASNLKSSDDLSTDTTYSVSDQPSPTSPPPIQLLHISPLYLTESQIQFYMGQLISVLAYLEELDYVYRDFKPENVMISKEGNIILTLAFQDFVDITFSNADYNFLPPDIKTSLEQRRKLMSMLGTSLSQINSYSPSQTDASALCKNDSKAIWWSIGLFIVCCILGYVC
eukprot:TRINITY_DN192_c0_g2_i1.p1 TRINITY_DN192_c0_g2~~TRINITY_DN192_c0_g2_i1.p1  ORF type:complete len:1970 (-),score=473.50 TRINITY_DN192_c0_g2_i1:68-5284(-)